MTNPIDIIICLGNGSMNGNDELRLMLRSLERYVEDAGRIFLATHYCPAWIDRDKIIVVDIDDVYLANKDANLHAKTLAVIRGYNITGKFCWLSDDVLFNSVTRLADIPILRGDAPLSFYSKDEIWYRRIRNTFEFCHRLGIDVKHSYEVHAPQTFNGQELLSAMEGVDYVTRPGLTIFTTWRAVCGEINHPDEQSFSLWKTTCHDAQAARNAKLDKPFIGYNDKAYNVFEFRKRLHEMFPEKSSFERF